MQLVDIVELFRGLVEEGRVRLDGIDTAKLRDYRVELGRLLKLGMVQRGEVELHGEAKRLDGEGELVSKSRELFAVMFCPRQLGEVVCCL